MDKKTLVTVLMGAAAIFIGNLAFEAYQKSKATAAA